jgi:hypothetical protein
MNTMRSFVRRALPAAAAIALVVAACATPAPSPGATATPEPSPRSTATPAPTAGPSPTDIGGAATAACRESDVELAHGRVDGAAGSRFTTMMLTVTGAAACTIPVTPTLALIDAGGAQLAVTAPPGPVATTAVPVGTAVTSNVQLANWCDPPPAEPLTLTLVLHGVSLPVLGGPYPDPGGLPGCNGAGGPTFAATDWQLP